METGDRRLEAFPRRGKALSCVVLGVLVCGLQSCAERNSLTQSSSCTLLATSLSGVPASIVVGAAAEGTISLTSNGCFPASSSTFLVSSTDATIATIALVAGTAVDVRDGEYRQTVSVTGLRTGTTQLTGDAERLENGASVRPTVVARVSITVTR